MNETTVIYLRLSKEDRLTKDESNSISNQRIMLRRFCASDSRLKDTQIVEIKDDGYSGKSMERPGMNRLLDMVRKNQVRSIVVKDLSRFSREYLELGKFLEHIFPIVGVRFIAVNDGYDSDTCRGGIGEIDTAFKGILNDYYVEDVSMKVKSALRNRRRSGKYIATSAPYGYRKCSDNKYKLEIDLESAKIVRRIFDEYVNGKSSYAIAKGLNADGIMTPGAYYRKRDGINDGKEFKSGWQTMTVSRILRNEVYLGHIVYGKCKEAETARRCSVQKEKSEWGKIENAHEAIVDSKVFEAASEKLKNNKAQKTKNNESPFKGKVVCANCGSRMRIGNSGKRKFECANNFFDEEKKKECAKSVREESIESAFKEKVEEIIESLKKQSDGSFDTINELKNAVVISREKLGNLNSCIEEFKESQMNAYEKFVEGVIDKEEYITQKNNCESLIRKLEDEICELENKISNDEGEINALKIASKETDALYFDSITREVVDKFLDKVIVDNHGNFKLILK